MVRRFSLLAYASALLASTSASAVGQSASPVSPSPSRDTYHATAPAEIIVTAPFARNQSDILSGTSVLSGQELTRDLRPSIGETLARQPGVSATSFGPNASRPILRGLQGDRIRVLTDGIGSFDASNTSVDHAVAINPLTAERIEVLRGPAALLYGSSAIGGVVNVIDQRIPRHVPDEAAHVDGIATYGAAADERSVSGTIDVPAGGKVVFHADGSYSKTGDLETGGYILAPAVRAQAVAAGGEPGELADLRGTLPNSAAETWDAAAGAAIITGDSNIGFSVNHYDSLYGVPVRYSLDPTVEAESVAIDMRQTRLDLRADLGFGGSFIDRVRFRGGIADYRHDEVASGTGDIETTFLSQGLEGRLEFQQARRGGWTGAFGAQGLLRDLNVIGEEKFVPKNETQQFGLFTLQSLEFGAVRAEAGVRYEHSITTAVADATIGNPDLERTVDSLSGSVGASVRAAEGVRLGLNATHSERAPAAEELFARGPHGGTQAYEVGSPDLAKETSNGLEATLKSSGDGYSLNLSAYYSWFNNFIYEDPSGDVEDGLPVFVFRQADARFYGFEVDASARLAQLGGTAIVADGLADYTHANLVGLGPVPRIPPLRLLGGLEAQGERLQGRVEIEHLAEQDRVATFETTTGSYTMVNASLAFNPLGKRGSTGITLAVDNIFDVVARRHASFLKDFAPLAGRDIRVSARFNF